MIGRFARLACALAAIGASVSVAQAQQAFPNKPVRVIAAYPPGSGPDAVMRIVSERLTKAWGQQVVIENRPTGNGLISGEAVKRSAADGYTLWLADDAHLSAHPFLYKQLPYDTLKDFEPVSMVYQTYFFFVVPSDAPYKNVNELIAAAKARGGKMTAASWGIGSIGHLGIARFEALTGTQFTHVPFQGTSLVYPAVGNKEVDWAFGSVASSIATFRAGKIRYLAAASPKRIVGFPDIPTVTETGGPPMEVYGFVTLMAPRGIPADVVTRINAEMARALADQEVREKLNGLGFEPWHTSAAELARQLDMARKRYSEIIARTKISLD